MEQHSSRGRIGMIPAMVRVDKNESHSSFCGLMKTLPNDAKSRIMQNSAMADHNNTGSYTYPEMKALQQAKRPTT